MPFELNRKLQYGFQISELMRAVCVGEQFDFEKRKEGGKDKSENLGVCLTCFYCFETYTKGVKGFRVILENGEEIESKRDSLIVIKSRFEGYKLEFEKEKGFTVQYWLNGPRDTKNDLF